VCFLLPVPLGGRVVVGWIPYSLEGPGVAGRA
jgi:hypothetical protein